MNRFVVALYAISILGAGCTSGTKQEAKVAEPSLQGTVTFICGSVQLIQGDAQTALDIGMSVRENATIVTGPDATCEVQFAEYGSVHLSPDTRLTVSHLLRSDGRTEAEMNLAVGAVVCKVRKLSGDDRFNVRTQEMVAGVRGTVFLVSTDGGDASRVAVTQGSVAILPASAVTVSAKKTVSTGTSAEPDTGSAANASASSGLSGAILAAMPRLVAGEEVMVTKASMEEAEKIIGEIYAEAPAAEGPVPEAVAERIGAAGNVMQAAGISGAPISPETQTHFDSAAYLDIRDLKLPPAESKADSDSKEAAVKDEKKLVSLTVSVDPPDATVSVNGAVLSRGAFRGLFGRDETVELAVTKEGYSDYRETVALTASDAVTRAVRLDSGAAPAETPADATTETPADEGLTIRFAPVSSSKIVALSAGSGAPVVAADASGKVFAIGADGKVLWSASTGNGTNENSQAVAGAGVVAYAGDRSLAVFNAATGAKLWEMALGKGNSGLFGRRPAFADSLLVMSSDAGIAAYDAKTGSVVADFSIAGGSDMSPCCSGGVLYIASKSGVFQAIDPASMTGKASVQTGAVQPVASAPAVSGKRAVFADRRGLVTAIALDLMTVAWQAKLDPAKNVEIFSDPVVAADSVCLTGKNVLYVLSVTDGAPRFAPLQGITTQPCSAKGYLWCGAGTTLKQIAPVSGKAVAEFPLAAAASGRPAFDGKVLYVPLANGSVGMMNLEKM